MYNITVHFFFHSTFFEYLIHIRLWFIRRVRKRHIYLAW